MNSDGPMNAGMRSRNKRIEELTQQLNEAERVLNSIAASTDPVWGRGLAIGWREKRLDDALRLIRKLVAEDEENNK